MFVSLGCDDVQVPPNYYQCDEFWRRHHQFAAVTQFDRLLSYNNRQTLHNSSFPMQSSVRQNHQINVSEQASSGAVQYPGWQQQSTSLRYSSAVYCSAPWNDNSTYLDRDSRRVMVDDCRRLNAVYSDDTAAARCCMNDELDSWRRHLSTSSTTPQTQSCCRYSTDVTRRAHSPSSDAAGSRRLNSPEGLRSSSHGLSADAGPTTASPGVRVQIQPRKTKDALVPLIIRAILSAADVRLSLSEICHYIEQQSADYGGSSRSDDVSRWQNNVRHTLSHYEFFVKCGRVPTGRGNYWTIHPVCRDAFAASDYRIKRARHAVQMYEKRVQSTFSSPQT